jgi:hypothetical protein
MEICEIGEGFKPKVERLPVNVVLEQKLLGLLAAAQDRQVLHNKEKQWSGRNLKEDKEQKELIIAKINTSDLFKLTGGREDARKKKFDKGEDQKIRERGENKEINHSE